LNDIEGIYWYPAGKGTVFGRGNSCNVFLIEQTEHKFLIDAGVGTGHKPQELERAIIKDGHNFREIKAILVTHGHADHINGLEYFKKKYPHLEIWCMKQEAPLIEKGDELKNRISEAGGDLLNQLYPAPFPIVKLAAIIMDGKYQSYHVDRYLEEKEIIPSSKNAIHVLSTAGHTEGHTSYYILEKQILLMGDLFDPRHEDGPLLNNANANFELFYRSLQMIAQLPIKTLCPSHGMIIEVNQDSPKKHIDHAIQNMVSALDIILNYLVQENNKFQQEISFNRFPTLLNTNIWPFFYSRTMAFSILKWFQTQNICGYNPISHSFYVRHKKFQDSKKIIDEKLKLLQNI
jgi:glyoxylase-like metal-dependent hydrolase (beta-lactamase superfamily II)